ncbi:MULTISPECIES: rhodanese-like domain-containing protein [unclassified Thermosynechococcus]|uniref:rhodanese-like domain-containing protein n=1 Tax=unclassified Thermosynechococcus TaxID=2622553 RepID=UPI002877FF1A|nr:MULTISPECIES: rhodanese-like domain-containing protein [unclassified Thermosynechococcus]WNC52889.1 rhodanese-like domain-containing protein [Thermosynechococcus sp. TG215]WNC57980.1 rhodanese-like domain-containing protein [Thermosynechococcus sp. TG218]
MTTATTESPLISAAELHDALQRQQVLLIDVREPSEYNNAHIPGALLCPLANVKELEPACNSDTPVVLYCESGRRSRMACEILASRGFANLKNLEGGIQRWKQGGYPITGAVSAPISLMRQVQIVAGSLILSGVLLGFAVHPGFFFLAGFVGAGLVFAGVTGVCTLARLLALLPFNRPQVK